jgi:hypothetical protein
MYHLPSLAAGGIAAQSAHLFVKSTPFITNLSKFQELMVAPILEDWKHISPVPSFVKGEAVTAREEHPAVQVH